MSVEKPENIYCELTSVDNEVISGKISRQKSGQPQGEEALQAVKRRQFGRCHCRDPE